MVDVTFNADGIATIRLDMPSKSVNTLSPTMLAALGEAVTFVENEQCRGVIVASGKGKSFVAGADLFELAKMASTRLAEFLATGQEVLNRLAGLPMPTVAAINGDCLGGGLELALACRGRIAAREPAIQIGAPEVKLGLVPGWGGTVRLPQTIGLKKALPLLVTGRTFAPDEALRLGIVDELAGREELLDAARRWVRDAHAPRIEQPWPEDAPAILDRAAADLLEQTQGHYPAPLRLVDVVRTAFKHGPQAGMDAERQTLVELAAGDVSKNLMRLFFLRQSARKSAYAKASGSPDKLTQRDIARAAVIGGGTMGVGIAYGLIRAGISVQLIEVDDAAVARAMNGLQNLWNMDLTGGRLTSDDLPELTGRVKATSDWTGLDSAEMVIEAVPEEMRPKLDVFTRLNDAAGEETILASNTSSLDIDTLAAAVRRPQRVVGLHFFNPVPRMPLVEIVRGSQTSPQTLCAGIRLAERLGKAPIIANNAPGFIINRVLMPYLSAAGLLAGEGVAIAEIDAAMKAWGWPMGPFELMDEIGLDVTAAIMRAMAAHFPALLVPTLLTEALDHGWLGKKRAIGFYYHRQQGMGRPVRRTLNPQLGRVLGAKTAAQVMDAEAIQRRLMGTMVEEARRLLADGVTDSADDVDLATVLGLGFPQFRGGLMRFAGRESA